MQIQVFRGAPPLLYRIIKPANSLDINPTKQGGRRAVCPGGSVREPLHSPAIQGQRREHGPSHKRVFASKNLSIFLRCKQSPHNEIRCGNSLSLSLHASFWRFITHEGEAQLCCNVGNLPSFRLILFPQQRHAAPLHDSSRFTLCRGEKKDGGRETHV